MGVRVCTLHLIKLLGLTVFDQGDIGCVHELVLLLTFGKYQVGVWLSRTAHATLLR